MTALAFYPLYVALATACRWLRGDRCAACGGMWSFAASWSAAYYCNGCWPHLRRGFARELAVETARYRNRCWQVLRREDV